MSDPDVRIYGIRHHGPGSARSLARVLARTEPDAVLVEGPLDAEPVLHLASAAGMEPPVALLVHARDEPGRAAFFPFASFSPEWVALRFAHAAGATVRFIDLPQSFQLAMPDEDDGRELSDAARDPLGALAAAAGEGDGERWWDRLVESAGDHAGPQEDPDAEAFAAVLDAMAALREADEGAADALTLRREAHMRKAIRAALKDGHARVAVVCGAWHAPALHPDAWPAVKDDHALLKGLARVRTEATWCPWTHGRLAAGSGYGAAVASPAWYELLFENPPGVATVWLTRAARLLRAEGLDASPASVIEAVRLAGTLATIRDRRRPLLEDLDEAAASVLAHGNDAPMRLIRRELVVGEKLGRVPEDAPAAPLQRDLAALQKRLRLPPRPAAKRCDLDLRKPNDLERSHLLHRLALLGVPWGKPEHAGGRGTFRESWTLAWEPEFAVRLLEASRLGNTVEAAANARAEATAATAAAGDDPLEALASLLDRTLLAALPAAAAAVVAALRDAAARGGDLPRLMAAVPPLARVARYGDVRGGDAGLVRGVLHGLMSRVCVGLPPACTGLGDDAAAPLATLIDRVHEARALLAADAGGPDDDAVEEEEDDPWAAALLRVVDRDDTHRLLAGRAARRLHDGGRLDDPARRLALALSPAAAPAEAAAWAEGFLSGSGALLAHDPALFAAVDAWVTGLSPAAFDAVLPLVRRTLATFKPPERRAIGERVRRGGGGGPEAPGAATAFLPARFDPALARDAEPVLRLLLGLAEADRLPGDEP